MKIFSTLFKRTSNGAVQKWTITANSVGYFTEEGLVGGKITCSDLHTVESKNEGKKNATTVTQQAEVEAEAKWVKQQKRGYTTNVHKIDNVTYQKPMKGDKWKDRADEVTWPVTCQDKLNGIRCQQNAERAYSTGGEKFWTITHIREALTPIFAAWPNAFIDGEAFNYGLRKKLNRLTKLVSVCYKEKDLTPELLAESKEIVQLHVFDGFGFNDITADTPWVQRHIAVCKIINQLNSPYIKMLPYVTVDDAEGLFQMLRDNRKSGGEGLMIRWGRDCPYKAGRSKYMLKLKHFEDAEFEIVDIQEGNANWKGCAKRIVLKLDPPATNATKDDTFASNIDGDATWLRDLYNNREKYIGEQATVEYQQLSEYGIPQIPWVRAIRNYE